MMKLSALYNGATANHHNINLQKWQALIVLGTKLNIQIFLFLDYQISFGVSISSLVYTANIAANPSVNSKRKFDVPILLFGRFLSFWSAYHHCFGPSNKFRLLVIIGNIHSKDSDLRWWEMTRLQLHLLINSKKVRQW